MPNKSYYTGACKGNGMTLGITDGTHLAGLSTLQNTGDQYLTGYSGAYGNSAGSSRTGTLNISSVTTIGITIDETKSGIIVEPDMDIKLVIKY